jgi:HEAT repeat protein
MITLTLALLLAAPVELHQPTSAPETGLEEDLSGLSVGELFQLVRDKRDRVDKNVFSELGKRKTRPALTALIESTGLVNGVWTLRYAYQAFSRFKDAEDLSSEAINFLSKQASSSLPRHSSAATYALTLFGARAHPKLQKILKTAKNPLSRSTALAPLLPEMAAGGSKADFKTTYENLILTYKVHRPLGVETFKAFAEAGGVSLFEKRLADKKISVEVRGMMITALEETPGEEALETLMGGLKAKTPRILYETLRALARRGTNAHLSALQKLTRHKDDSVRHEALISKARLSIGDPDFLEDVIDLAKDKDPIERGAAAISLGELKTPDAMTALHGLLEDDEYTVRTEALIGISIARHRSSIPVLASRLDGLKGAERERTHRELRLLTGQDQGLSSRRWAQWWQEEGDGFTVPSVEDAATTESKREERRESNETQSTFYGLSISSDRVCFVLDLSGSMNFRTKSGKTRLAVLKSEMSRFLGDYPSGDLFNMIFFGNDAEKWRQTLTLMNEKVRTEAIEHTEGLESPGATAVYNGLEAAFEDPFVDTIYLLTDGGPTGGKIDDIDEIIMEVNRWNSLRHVVIHSVAVGRKSPLLAALSSDSNGQYVVVD